MCLRDLMLEDRELEELNPPDGNAGQAVEVGDSLGNSTLVDRNRQRYRPCRQATNLA